MKPGLVNTLIGISAARTFSTMAVNSGFSWPLTKITEPSYETDVIFESVSTGTSSASIFDSVRAPTRFRDLVLLCKDRYEQCKPMEKPIVASEIVNAWRDQDFDSCGSFDSKRNPDPRSIARPGRFLRYDPKTRLWADVGNKKAREKISKLLREIIRADAQGPVASLATEAEASLSKDNGDEDTVERPASDGLVSSPSKRKLYNRSSQLSALITAYNRLRHEPQENPANTTSSHQRWSEDVVVIVSGPTASGKTRLINELRSLVLLRDDLNVESGETTGESGIQDSRSGFSDSERQGCPSGRDCLEPGYFLMAKFDQFQEHVAEPFSVLNTALSDFCQQVAARGHQDEIKERIHDAIPAEYERLLLVSMLPVLSNIVGSAVNQESFSSIEDGVPFGTNAKNVVELRQQRSSSILLFKFVFRKFVRAISNTKYPLVLAFDDVQYADEESIDVLNSLLLQFNESQAISRDRRIYEQSGFLLICTESCTGNEVSSRLSRRLTSSAGVGGKLINVSLRHFDTIEITLMLQDMFMPCDRSGEKSTFSPLAALVSKHTSGNIFFIHEFLSLLVEEELLLYDTKTKRFTWDLHDIELVMDTQTIEGLIGLRLSLLPPKTQEMVHIAAHLGCKLRQDVLSLLVDEPLDRHLDLAWEGGILTRKAGAQEYYFTHDTVQESIYKSRPESERKQLHRRLGRRLWKKVEESRLSKYVFIIVGQMMLGHENSTLEANASLAYLCLMAGQQAVHLSSFRAAHLYFRYGISLLKERDGWKDHYPVKLALHNFAAEVAYCNAEYEEVAKYNKEVLKYSRSLDDTLQIQGTLVYSLASNGKADQAIDEGLELLRKLGHVVPRKSGALRIAHSLWRTKKRLKSLTNRSILDLPLLEEPRKIQVMTLLSMIFLSSFYHEPELAILVAINMVDISIESGLSAVSSVGFVCYGMTLVGGGRGGDVEEGYRFGKLSVEILKRFRVRAWDARVLGLFYGCCCGWKEPVRDLLEPLREGYHAGMASGDVEMACLNYGLFCWIKFEVSSSLEVMVKDATDALFVMRFFSQWINYNILLAFKQMCINLIGAKSGHPWDLSGDLVGDATMFLAKQRSTTRLSYLWSSYFCLLLSYLFGRCEKAEEHARAVSDLISHFSNSSDISLPVLIDGLSAVSYSRKCKTWAKRRMLLARARSRLRLFRKWAVFEPTNFLCKQYLLDAELSALIHDKQTLGKFVSAIALAGRWGFLFQEALGNELAGNYCASIGNIERSKSFYLEALSLYNKWGCQAKVDHLRDELKRKLLYEDTLLPGRDGRL